MIKSCILLNLFYFSCCFFCFFQCLNIFKCISSGLCYLYNYHNVSNCFRYMVLFLVAHCQTTILRLGCGSYAHFGVIEPNRKLPEPFLTLYGPDTEWCKLQCIAHPSCKSISFREEGVCELNNKTANDHTSKITTIYHEKWTYYTTHYNDPFVSITKVNFMYWTRSWQIVGSSFKSCLKRPSILPSIFFEKYFPYS